MIGTVRTGKRLRVTVGIAALLAGAVACGESGESTRGVNTAGQSAPEGAEAVPDVELPAAPPPNSGCEGNVIAQQDIVHPDLGPTRVFLLLGSSRVGEGCISAVTGDGTALPPITTGVYGDAFAFAEPATDSTGNTFVTYNPGRYDGYIVLVPTEAGFADMDNGLNYSGRYNFYYASLEGPGSNGEYTIVQHANDCDPTCAEGTLTEEELVWNGSDYVPG